VYILADKEGGKTKTCRTEIPFLPPFWGIFLGAGSSFIFLNEGHLEKGEIRGVAPFLLFFSPFPPLSTAGATPGGVFISGGLQQIGKGERNYDGSPNDCPPPFLPFFPR